MAEALIALIVVAGLVRIVDRWLTYRERVRRVSEGLYTADVVVLAIRAGVYRAADPEMGPELMERLVTTVAEDLDNGTLTDPRDPSPPIA